jgi:hypothetical protein
MRVVDTQVPLSVLELKAHGRHAFSSLANASSTAGLLVAAAAACSVFSFACFSRSRRTAEIWNRRRNGQLHGLNGPLNGPPISGHLTAAAAQWLIFDGVDLRGRHGLIYVTRSSNVGDLAYAQLRRECDALPAMISPACFVGTSPSVVLDFATRFDSWHSRNSFHSERSAGHSAKEVRPSRLDARRGCTGNGDTLFRRGIGCSGRYSRGRVLCSPYSGACRRRLSRTFGHTARRRHAEHIRNGSARTIPRILLQRPSRGPTRADSVRSRRRPSRPSLSRYILYIIF